MKILVPVDGSKNSLNAVQFIGSRKTLLGSEPKIELLNVQLPLPARACRLVGQDAIQRYYEDEAEKVFEPSRKILEKEGYQASEAFTVGEAAPTIAKAAEDIDADLIVMGSRGQSALKGLSLVLFQMVFWRNPSVRCWSFVTNSPPQPIVCASASPLTAQSTAVLQYVMY